MLAQFVLIDGDGMLVGENRSRRVAHVGYIVTRNQRRSEDAPHGEVSPVLVVGESSVANLHYVRGGGNAPKTE